jgi:hypothetical protein
LEYHIVSTLTQRRTIHPSHGHTQSLGDDSTLIEENDAPTTGGQLNSHTEENDAPSRGYAQHWAPSQVDSTSVTEENVSWRMSHDAAIINTSHAKFKYGRVVMVSYSVNQSPSQGVFPKKILSKSCNEYEVDGVKAFGHGVSNISRAHIVSFMGAFVEGVLHPSYAMQPFSKPFIAINLLGSEH